MSVRPSEEIRNTLTSNYVIPGSGMQIEFTNIKFKDSAIPIPSVSINEFPHFPLLWYMLCLKDVYPLVDDIFDSVDKCIITKSKRIVNGPSGYYCVISPVGSSDHIWMKREQSLSKKGEAFIVSLNLILKYYVPKTRDEFLFNEFYLDALSTSYAGFDFGGYSTVLNHLSILHTYIEHHLSGFLPQSKCLRHFNYLFSGLCLIFKTLALFPRKTVERPSLGNQHS